MYIAYIVIAVLLSLALVASAALKLRRDPRAVQSIHETVGVPLRWFPYLAACEIAAAAGLLIGIAWAPLGILAAAATAAYMIGALIGHIRVHDTKNLTNPLIPLLLAAAALTTRILSI